MEKLSNQDIQSLCKKYNINAGPVSDTTRFLYERRLKECFEPELEPIMDRKTITYNSQVNPNKKRKLDK